MTCVIVLLAMILFVQVYFKGILQVSQLQMSAILLPCFETQHVLNSKYCVLTL